MPNSNNNPHQPISSRAKRDPGFAKIRRGLLEHLPELSSNAIKLYLYLHLTAYWQGPKRGWVEASFDDIARGLGWSQKTLQRTMEELEAIPFVEVERAANQYDLTRIKILKYDVKEAAFAVDKSVHSSSFGVDSGVDSGVDKSDHCAVHSKPPSPLNASDLEVPKKAVEVKKEKKGRLDAVRRPFDAGRPSSKKTFPPSGKSREALCARIEHRIAED